MENNIRFDVLKLDDDEFFIKFDEQNMEFIAHLTKEEVAGKNILELMRLVDERLEGLGNLIPQQDEGQAFEAAELQRKKYRAEIRALIATRIMEIQNESSDK